MDLGAFESGEESKGQGEGWFLFLYESISLLTSILDERV